MKTTPVRASILAIGTELTTGQIINRNAAWISEKIGNIGVEVLLHETVPDDRPLMLEALDRCAKASPLIFITGGLGPTTDDFTRDVVSDWVKDPLVFHEPSWTRIQERLNHFGIRVAESNRQQCYFPSRAKVLTNPRGTADAFFLTRGETRIWVLPGPPAEIAAIWENARIENEIQTLFPTLEKVELLTWECLGKSEAELGEIVERALSGSGLKTGYRAHRPYIQVKVWCPQDQLQAALPFIQRLEMAIEPWLMLRGQNGETGAERETDLARGFLKTLKVYKKIVIHDSATGGILSERISPFLRTSEFHELSQNLRVITEWHPPFSDRLSPQEWVARKLESTNSECLVLALCGFSNDGQWSLGLGLGAQVCQIHFDIPYASKNLTELAERAQRYAAEKALSQFILFCSRHANAPTGH